ncbi:MAG: NUDIX hydrolase [Planctomycetes bacterium]|nr:NUDIX hydrolase [Planctomycetota bacterium]
MEQHDVPDRQGKNRRYDRIVLPGAAVALPILDDGRVVLINNHRFAVGQRLLELPAGMLDGDEPPIECARRELCEETGYRAGRLEPLLSFFSTPGICNEELHAFLATELVSGETTREPGERIENAPMRVEEALEAIGDGRIKDAKTIVTLLYYDRYVRTAR